MATDGFADLPRDCDSVVIAAYFAPPHAGHLRVLERAQRAGRRLILLGLGADNARTLATPWPTALRRRWIESLASRVPASEVRMLRDIPYDQARWRHALKRLLADCGRIALVADPALDLPCPDSWYRCDAGEPLEADAAALRHGLFAQPSPDWRALAEALTPATVSGLRAWCASDDFRALADEAAFIRNFRERWSGAPYAPVFVTVDALVTCDRHLLLVQRKRAPGRGLWALPGGFLDPDETLAAAARRELGEETGLRLAGCAPVATRVFDQPQRSLRGRTITHVFQYTLAGRALPPLTAADDAAAARWVPLHTLEPATLFEDHYPIVQAMLNLP